MVTDRVREAMEVARRELEASGRFDSVVIESGMLVAHASEAPEGAFYRVEVDAGGVFVSWVSADRYLSQSIEQTLVYGGDDLDDMIDEELVDTGYEGKKLAPMQHYRNDEKLFVFRSRTPIDAASCDAARAGSSLAKFVLAYEAAVGQLGDMSPDEED
ncbi:MAG: hypothetical protein R3B46_06020 [Phycisphaerales bacterium]